MIVITEVTNISVYLTKIQINNRLIGEGLNILNVNHANIFFYKTTSTSILNYKIGDNDYIEFTNSFNLTNLNLGTIYSIKISEQIGDNIYIYSFTIMYELSNDVSLIINDDIIDSTSTYLKNIFSVNDIINNIFIEINVLSTYTIIHNGISIGIQDIQNYLTTGNNFFTVNVTAQNNNVQPYNINIHLYSNDTSLYMDSSFISNVVNVNYGTTEKIINITTADYSTFTINGQLGVQGNNTITNLNTGDNPIIIVVTAEDGITTHEYTYNIHVVDTSFTINAVSYEYYINNTTNVTSSSINVTILTTNNNAKFTINGNTGIQGINTISNLSPGNNYITCRVISAEDNNLYNDYVFIVCFIQTSLSNDTSLSTFMINEIDAIDLVETIYFPYNIDSVNINIITSNENATVSFINTQLNVGNNDISFTVTAQDGTTQTYTATVVRELNNDTSLSTFTINGLPVNGTIHVDHSVDSVTVVAIPTDTNAGVSGTGDIGLIYGSNTITVTVTAQNGAVQTYTKTVFRVAAENLVCFNKDTKILTDQGYVPIQDLKEGDLIKTLKHDYVPLVMIGNKTITNIVCDERIKNKLYKCTKDDYGVFEDLILTGSHSILVDELTQLEKIKSILSLGHIFKTDDKYRLPACIDDKPVPVESGVYTIYHFVLENDNEYTNYGIYANGLLVESCSKYDFLNF